MDNTTYESLLAYYQSQDTSWTNYQKLPHPKSARILPAYAHKVVGLISQSGMWYSKKGTSNMVKVEHNDKVSWGVVLHIFELFESKDRIVMVRWLKKKVNPLLDPIMDWLGWVHLVCTVKTDFVSASQILCTLFHRALPAWSLGSQSPSLLLIDFNPGDYNSMANEDMDNVYMANAEDQMDID
ncbi:uncharacterized protein MELLADRAFT_66517 [Melampsora larici-populina 98AG31]|uniref:Uncharacterized protein n=1 Tax=Melampsora larici-populina (strain 98AG31 / pathotype 3-4-7) TaxID=747676 RepID=F4RZJ0_MELLP|nr:uncharacterized protein MELLADRAFT_66517 [Melampsora larici-populina 98AG31]EGG02238.1 hypothetical protein MELLADRAFT_66517 [Melampsora larici-populina 98AG31]